MIYFRRPLATCHPSGVQEVLSAVFYTHSAPLGLLLSQISTILLIGHAKLTLINVDIICSYLCLCVYYVSSV